MPSTDDLIGYAENARKHLDQATALMVYIDGNCGGDCSRGFDCEENPRRELHYELANAAGYLRELKIELENRQKAEEAAGVEDDEESAPTSQAAEE